MTTVAMATNETKNLIPSGDAERVQALQRQHILDTPSEQSLRNLAETAALIFGVPIGLISFVDAERVFIKENYGGSLSGTSIKRNRSLCSVVVLSDEPTIFTDLQKEPCHLISGELVGKMGLRFYAGAPIKDEDGEKIGALAIADSNPREFSFRDEQILANLAKVVGDKLTLRKYSLSEISELSKQVHEHRSNLYQTSNELRQSQAELDNFLYRASHDLKGPISTMAGLLNLAQQEIHDTAAISYLNKLSLVNDNMNESLSKLAVIYSLIRENDANHLRRQELERKDLKKIIDDILLDLRREVDQKLISVKTEIGDVKLFANRQYIQMVLTNIIENAVHFIKSTPGRDPEIKIEATPIDRYAQIKIKDNGEGIPQEYHHKVFDLFFRGNNSAKSGMGLYIVNRLVEKMNGNVKLRSEVGKSTEFTVMIPTSY